MVRIVEHPSGCKKKFYRRRKKSFNRDANRRREIERHAIHIGAFQTDDWDRWALAWCWHNPRATDLRWSLRDRVWRIAKRWLTDAEVEEVVADVENKRTRRRMSADNLARWLGITYEQRMRLRIRSIGSIDVDKAGRKELRKKRDRAYQARKRIARGARPRALYEANSKSQTQPWKDAGMSRRTWYRRQKAAEASKVTITTKPEIVVSPMVADLIGALPCELRIARINPANPSARGAWDYIDIVREAA